MIVYLFPYQLFSSRKAIDDYLPTLSSEFDADPLVILEEEFVLIGQAAEGTEVPGVYRDKSTVLEAVRSFGHNNPFTSFHDQVTAADYPHLGGNTLEIAWDGYEWVWA